MKAEIGEVFRASQATGAELRRTQSSLEEQVCEHTRSCARRDKELEWRKLEVRCLTESLETVRKEAAESQKESASFQEECITLRKKIQEQMETVNSATLATDMQARNYQLFCTVEHFKQQCQVLEVDNHSLRQSVEVFEEMFGNVYAASDSKFTLDASQEEKRTHTIQLKEENNTLREQLCTIQKEFCALQVKTRETMLETLPSVSCLLQAGSSQSSSLVGTDVCSTMLNHFVPQRFESVRAKLCRQADTALEGILQDWSHAQLLMEHATTDYDNAKCHDFSGLLHRLRSVSACRRQRGCGD